MMLLLPYLSVLPALAAFAASTQVVSAQSNSSVSGSDLHLGPIAFVNNNNYVYRDDVTSVQVVITGNTTTPESKPARFICAFPRGNSGFVTYFQPTSGVLALNLDNTTFSSVSRENNQTGFTGHMNVSSDFSFGETFIGSIRTVRDYVEGNGTRHQIFNYTMGPYNSSSVQLVRNWINGTTVQYLDFSVVDNFNISVTPNQNATLPPQITLTRPDASRNGTLAFTTTFNYTETFESLQGLGRSDIFATDSSSSGGNASSLLGPTLQAINNGQGVQIADQATFLSYEDVFFAGGWRFLTYFGRDTLLSLRLLFPTLTSTARQTILKAVLERISTDKYGPETGRVCHEETIGDYASFVNIQNNQSELGDTPSYNYVMVDSDFLLLPVLADTLVTAGSSSSDAQAFLSQNSTLNNGTLQSLLMLNVDHVMNLTMPFTQNQTYSNLVRIRDAAVGDWRDSTPGLGYGKFAFDINTAFVPAALRAIALLSDAGILPSNYSNATAAAEIWETSAYKFFEVPIDSATASSRLNNYIQQANLSSSAIAGAGSLNNTASSSGEWVNSTYTIGSGNSTFYALSLMEDGTPVEVLHSDLGFVLEYNDKVPAAVIKAVIEAMRPYPEGLLTNVGMVVADAAYDQNTTNIETFSNVMYHGAVSWSWQQGMMAKGIARQLALAGASNSTSLDLLPPNATKPEWAMTNPELIPALQAAEIRLWDSIAGSADVLYTEVWTPIFDNSTNTFSIGDLGAISPTGTEGDAIQLWSYGFLGLIDPRTGRPVAAGF